MIRLGVQHARTSPIKASVLAHFGSNSFMNGFEMLGFLGTTPLITAQQKLNS